MDDSDFNRIRTEAVLLIGRLIADYRGRHGQMLTQQLLADAVATTRTKIAHLEEGRELPDADLLVRICEHLNIPRQEWVSATHSFYLNGYCFHRLVCELTGRHVSLAEHAATDQLVALDRAKALFDTHLTSAQAHAQVNALLVFYGERPVSTAFFERYLDVGAFKDCPDPRYWCHRMI